MAKLINLALLQTFLAQCKAAFAPYNHTHSYAALTDKPTIGTGILTIKHGATELGTFNANATTNTTVTVPAYVLPQATATTLGGVMVDTALSGTSTNPVQNKVVKSALDGKSATGHTHGILTIKQNGANAQTYNGSAALEVDVTKSKIGLGNVTNDAQVKRTEMGTANGVATLDAAGKVTASQLPSFVDDVVELENKITALSGMTAGKTYYYENGDTKKIVKATSATAGEQTAPETGKIYVYLGNAAAGLANNTFRWSGSTMVEISQSLALGTTSTTAFAGDKGQTAYLHATKKGIALSSNLYRITTNDQGHVTAGTVVTTATTSVDGLMSSADKTKLDGVEAHANNYSLPAATANTLGGVMLDAALSTTSANPVQNKAVTTALNGKSDTGHTHTKAQITDFPTSLKNPSALTIKFNGGSTEGTSLFTYDGSAAKTANITPVAIGAANKNHTHPYTDITGTPSISNATIVLKKNSVDYGSFTLNGSAMTLELDDRDCDLATEAEVVALFSANA